MSKKQISSHRRLNPDIRRAIIEKAASLNGRALLHDGLNTISVEIERDSRFGVFVPTLTVKRVIEKHMQDQGVAALVGKSPPRCKRRSNHPAISHA
ncbi:MAG: hypothetical protein ABSA74_00135 [Candidatus Staskawiczbacteria bacterium]